MDTCKYYFLPILPSSLFSIGLSLAFSIFFNFSVIIIVMFIVIVNVIVIANGYNRSYIPMTADLIGNNFGLQNTSVSPPL